MTQDPNLEFFKSYDFLAEYNSFKDLAKVAANLAFQLIPNKPRKSDTIIASDRTRIIMSRAQMAYRIEGLQMNAFPAINDEVADGSFEDFVIERVRALNPFNQRIFEIRSKIDELDLQARESLYGFSIIKFIKDILEGDDEAYLEQVRVLLNLYGQDPFEVGSKSINFENLITKFVNTDLFIEIFRLYVELQAIEGLNKLVIKNTLESLDRDEHKQIRIDYIDLVFDFFTDPNNSEFVLPETVSYVLDLFSEHISNSRYHYNATDGDSAYAVLKGNEHNLEIFEQRYGDLNLSLTRKLRDIEALVIDSPEYIMKKKRERRVENLVNTIESVKATFTAMGVNSEVIFDRYILKLHKNDFTNPDIASFQDIDNLEDLTTAVLYLLAYHEENSDDFHAFEKHKSTLTEAEIVKFFEGDLTRTAHGIFNDERYIAIAFIMATNQITNMLRENIDLTRESFSEVTVDLKREVGKVYTFNRGIISSDPRSTNKVRFGISYKPGKQSRRTLVSIFPVL